MTDLLRAEFLRLVSRRVTWLVLLAALLVAALGAVTTSSATRPLDAQDHASAQRSYEESVAERDRQCEDFPEECAQWPEPAVTDFLRQPMDYEPYMSTVLGFGILFVALGAVLAAALVGGEFRSGAISTQLTFTPRRLPVMFAKLVAATTGAVAITVAYLVTGLVIGTISFLMVRGAGDLTATAELPLGIARMLVTAVLVAALAAALAFVTGSTLLSVGLGLLALMVSEFVMTSAGNVFPSWMWLLPTPNLMALLYSEYEYYRWDPVLQESVPVVVAGFWQAVAYGLVLVAATVVIGAISFRKRDLLR